MAPRQGESVPELAVQMEGIVKRFPGVVANDGIDFALEGGEIHGLLGENGAGKTVLMSVLYGLYHPDAGTIRVWGEPQTIPSPATAIRLGIGMVHQHFMLVPRLTVAENIMLGRESTRGKVFLDPRAARDHIAELAEQYGLSVDSRARVEQLSVGHQQRVEIVKALYRGAEILILDEPTAVLTEAEVEHLSAALRKMKAEGKSTVFITHKLGEALALCDRITVLRRGKVVGTVRAADTDERALAGMMVGREVVFTVRRRGAGTGQETALTVENLTAHDDRGLPALKGISLEVRTHEILGIAGVEGNGQAELEEVLTGLRRPEGGTIRLGDLDLAGRSAQEFIAAGVAHIPADRHRRGLVLTFTLKENAVLGRHRDPRFAIGPFWHRQRAMTRFTQEIMDAYGVKAPSPHTLAQNLSGGNQQRLIIGREFSKDPRVIIAAQPTRGLDVGGIEYIREQLLAMRDRGAAVLLISMDLDEILMLSDRIAVIYDGRIVGIEDPEAVDRGRLGELMLRGADREEVRR